MRDDDGALRPVVKIAKTKAAAEHALKVALKDSEAPTAPSAKGYSRTMVVADAAELWLGSILRADSGKSDRTRAQYEACVRNHVRSSQIAAKEIRRIKVSTVETWLQHVADTTGTGAAKTARTVISNVLDAAMRAGALDNQPGASGAPGEGGGAP